MVLLEAASAAADPFFTGTHIGMGVGPMVLYALYRDVIPALKELLQRRNGNGNGNGKSGESQMAILASLAASVARQTALMEAQAAALDRQTKILSGLTTDLAIVLDRTPRKE